MKLIAILLAILNLVSKPAVAVSENLLMTEDGNVWEVLDELETGKEYTVVFNTLGDDIVENDEVVRVRN